MWDKSWKDFYFGLQEFLRAERLLNELVRQNPESVPVWGHLISSCWRMLNFYTYKVLIPKSLEKLKMHTKQEHWHHFKNNVSVCKASQMTFLDLRPRSDAEM